MFKLSVIDKRIVLNNDNIECSKNIKNLQSLYLYYQDH